MNAALTYFQGMQPFQTRVSSAWEALLTGLVFAAEGIAPPTIKDSDDVVERLFVIDRNDEAGRLKPFRWSWSQTGNSGRKTVWNQTTRGANNLAGSLFVGADIRQGLRTDAATVLVNASPHRPSKEALTALLTRGNDFEDGDSWDDAHKSAASLLGLSTAGYDSITDSTISVNKPLLAETAWSPSALPERLKPAPTTTIQTPSRGPGQTLPTALDSLVIETRTERMLRRAAARFPFILLVGPPGTGKSTLVTWLTQQVRDDPTSFGFPQDFDPNPSWRTPDESWSAFDLIGGLVPDEEGVLSWSAGSLPNAVAGDRWLVLDETNRADMDKIMGPILTWLSAQGVEIGTSRAHAGTPVTLDWNEGPTSTYGDYRYGAGSSWRLFGTYNPSDARRVFRMGLALSRRFVVVPIPALDPASFEALLSKKFPTLDQNVADCVLAMYSAHFVDPHTQLGPAVFLRIAEYGLEDEEGSAGNHAEELLAEAYVMNLGTYVAAYDDAVLEALGQRLVENSAISEDSWSWIKSHRSTLG